ncbi:MAG: hypothetical protein ACOVMO_12595 [Caulobacter sp.]
MRRLGLPRSALTVCAGALALVLAVAFMVIGERPPARVAAAQAQASPCNVFGVQPVTLTPTLPTSFASATAQLGADCMAWQSFISLNWAADPNNPGQPDPNVPASSFGAPGDTSPKVWETYLEASAVFSAPQGSAKTLWAAERPAIKSLVRVSKQGATDLSLSGIRQAGDGKWLTSQAGQLTYYEVRMNQDEYQFITTNVFSGSDLTTYAGQAACAAGQNGKGGLILPAGGGATGATLDADCLGNPAKYGANVGAIEIKAAWVPLPSDHSLDYRYKTAVARVTNPDTGQTTQVTVGLVGLHIIRKVQGAPQFVWATFEQIDNSPDEAGGGFSAPALPANPHQKALGRYTYFNPNCTTATDPTYKCQHNALPGPPCDAKGQPAGCYPYSAPMQITRLVPVDATANAVTGYVWSLLPANSVYNYYRLINVQWPNSPTIVKAGSTVPLPNGDITPSSKSGIVANTTLETYQQSKNACMDCHQSAPIATPKPLRTALVAGRGTTKVQPKNLVKGSASLASDYSFVFVSETRR